MPTRKIPSLEKGGASPNPSTSIAFGTTTHLPDCRKRVSVSFELAIKTSAASLSSLIISSEDNPI